MWDKKSDNLMYDNLQLEVSGVPTRRKLLKTFATLFDPLGLICPVTVEMKILFQDVCKAGIGWDETLNPEFQKRWETICIHLEQLNEILISRCYCYDVLSNPIVDVEIHSFSDAAKRMYATCIYVRVRLKSGEFKSSLVTAKAKIFDGKKAMTIPRGELQGVVLMTDVYAEVSQILKEEYAVSKSYFWTDSTIVHCWVKNKDKDYKPYVQDRLKKIRKVILDEHEWMLVPTKMNPADLGTRGVTPHNLSKSRLWLYGPEFLGCELRNVQLEVHVDAEMEGINGLNLINTIYSNDLGIHITDKNMNVANYRKFMLYDKDTLVENKIQLICSSVCCINVIGVNACNDEELLISCSTMQVSKNTDDEPRISKVMKINRFNDVMKLLRVTAWIIRFKNKLKQKIASTKIRKSRRGKQTEKVEPGDEYRILTAEELQLAKRLWVGDVQHGIMQSSNFKLLRRQLNLFQDQHQLIRCGSRLKHAEIGFDNKYPYLLRKDHRFADLVVMSAHLLVKHSNLRSTVNQLRTEYWIPKCRPFVKQIISSCTLCRTFQSSPYNYPEDSQLPVERLAMGNAYECIGIDYAGPLHVKDAVSKDGKMYKVWVGLITCGSCRAVYLDLVPDCSGASCVNLLTRFINTRGTPGVVISDNGSSFANKEVQDYACSLGITWKFNVPLAPWMGGFFESMVKSMKSILRKAIRNVRLNYVEMLTVLKEVENVINNRPLSYVYYDELYEVLTPNKLVYGKNLDVIVTSTSSEGITADLSKRATHLESVINSYWGMWQKDYLANLREAHQKRYKRARNSIDPNIDDVVLVHDEKLKRSEWKLGRIDKLILGADGKCRAADVIVISNQKRMKLTRPVNLLYPVESSVTKHDYVNHQ